MCQCGCKGWCTLYPLLEAWKWDFNQASEGVWSHKKHDGKYFAPGDGKRFTRRGASMGFKIAVIETKSDWPAWCEVGGFRGWAHTWYPCACCSMRKSALATLEGITLEDGPWETWTREHYDMEVRRCMVVVRIATPADQQLIFQALRYSKKQLGRFLVRGVPRLGLEQNDRLEPSPSILDVANFEHQPPPFVATFWRITRESRIVHRSPLYDIRGVNPDSHGIDALHTWTLGPVGDYVGFTLHVLIARDVYGTDIPHLTKEDSMQVNLLQLKADMWAYYGDKRRNDPHFKKKGSQV